MRGNEMSIDHAQLTGMAYCKHTSEVSDCRLMLIAHRIWTDRTRSSGTGPFRRRANEIDQELTC